MAPKIKVPYEDIVTEALQIVREKGIEAVNARSVAARLNCSVQPIFRTFGTMDELKTAVLKRANEIYEGVMVFMYIRLAKREEKDMLREFGEDYKSYMAKTKMLIPFVV